ncbi:Uncharacterized protein At1g01500 [Linum grandiflorum]
MESPYERNDEDEGSNLQIIKYSPFQPSRLSSPWLELRVFYVRISNFPVDDTTPEFLTINHIPLSPDTLVEVNGARSSMYSDGAPLLLRRDRVDKRFEEVTFVSTDSVRTTGSVKFEVFDKDDLLLSGTMEMSMEPKSNVKRWSMQCESEVTPATNLLKGKSVTAPEIPTVEVFVTGSFSGKPVILTKTLRFCCRKKHTRKGKLDSIPEDETTDLLKPESPQDDLQVIQYLLICSNISIWFSWMVCSSSLASCFSINSGPGTLFFIVCAFSVLRHVSFSQK